MLNAEPEDFTGSKSCMEVQGPQNLLTIRQSIVRRLQLNHSVIDDNFWRESMRVWSCSNYGDPSVLLIEERQMPEPTGEEVLVRVHCTTVNSGDVRVRALDMPAGMKTLGRLALGWNGPRQGVLGTEFSGVVHAVGPEANGFAPGDRVFAFPGGKMGAHAEYVLMPASGRIAHIPDGLGFEEAAALCFGGSTALHYLRKAAITPGDKLLVLGGSGAVGLALIQLARAKGAVVAATSSKGNHELLTACGAATVFDYHTVDPVAAGWHYDVIADCAAASNFAAAQKALHPGGKYLAIAGGMKEMFGSLRQGADGTRMIAGPADERVEDLAELAEMAFTASFRPHIDQVYAFDDMPAAHAYVDSKRKRGSVVVQVSQ
jgi:NADPH:quinone reductase-like Zn-dependent oxidoreductase